MESSSDGDVARIERDRTVDLERQLAAALAGQTERDRKIQELNDAVSLQTTLLEQAEARADDGTASGRSSDNVAAPETTAPAPPPIVKQKAHFHDFLKYFSEWRHAKLLIGTGGCWVSLVSDESTLEPEVNPSCSSSLTLLSTAST